MNSSCNARPHLNLLHMAARTVPRRGLAPYRDLRHLSLPQNSLSPLQLLALVPVPINRTNPPYLARKVQSPRHLTVLIPSRNRPRTTSSIPQSIHLNQHISAGRTTAPRRGTGARNVYKGDFCAGSVLSHRISIILSMRSKCGRRDRAETSGCGQISGV